MSRHVELQCLRYFLVLISGLAFVGWVLCSLSVLAVGSLRECF